GQTTNLISYDADAATIQARLRELASGAGATVTAADTSQLAARIGTLANPWKITFVGAAPTLTVDNRKLYSPYDQLAIPTVVAEAVDDDSPSVVITPLDSSGAADAVTRVLEDGFGDSYTIRLTQRPLTTLTVDAVFDPLLLSLTSTSPGFSLVSPGRIRFT